MEDQLLETLKSIYRIVLDNVPIIQSTEDIKPKSNTFVLKRKKVYCSDCEFYLTKLPRFENELSTVPCLECSYEKNINRWYSEKPSNRDSFNRKPYQINQHNDCEWFTVKLDGRN